MRKEKAATLGDITVTEQEFTSGSGINNKLVLNLLYEITRNHI